MRKFLIVLVSLALLYSIGPTPDTPVYDTSLPDLPSSAEALETYVEAQEQRHILKPNNEALIVWNDALNKTKTKVAIVYLHGFSASRKEGTPTHRDFAKKYGCNLYLARLSDHGIDTTDALYAMSPDRLWNSAKEAYAIGKQLGDEVVIMSTSTGGTLALKLAAEYPEIKGLINFSPNIEVNDPLAFMLNDPWGLQISKLYFQSDFRTINYDEESKKYWNEKYRLESVVALEELLETVCTKETFEAVTCPVLNMAYYRDEENQDAVVRVSAMRKMHSELGTAEDQKVIIELPNAGTHVIAYKAKSGAYTELFEHISDFAESQLSLQNHMKNSHK